MPTIKDSSSIEEVLQYIVACYGAEIYQEKQRLSNLIADLYTGEERLKRLYRRMVMEDAVSQQLYSISLKPIQEREGFYNSLVYQFKEANFYEEAFARQVLDVFLHGMNLLLVEPISTKTTEADGEWVDEYGVKYSADRKKLIRAPKSLCGDYRVLDGTVVICDDTFRWRDNMREITLPSSVTSIGDKAFSCCLHLQEITLPSSVTSIGRRAFTYCSNLREINTAESNKVYRAIDGVLYTKDLKTIIRYPVGKEDKKFVIPSGITSIGDETFYQCESLKNITLPPSVTSIGKGAFWVCRSLETITLPPSVTSIGNNAFYNCSNLQEINIPSSVTSIGDDVFNGCWNLKEINVAESNKFYRNIDGVLYTKDLKTIICYPAGKMNRNFVIPSGVTSIGDKAFIECENLHEITLPSGVMSIGDGAFAYCSNLQEITLPSGVTCIGDETFYECENLHRINIPRGTLEKFKKLLPKWTDKLHEI